MVFSSALRGFLPTLALVGVGLGAPRAGAGAPPGTTDELPLETGEAKGGRGDGLGAGEGAGARGPREQAAADAPEDAEPGGEGDAPALAPDDDEARKQAALASFEEARRLFLAEDYAAAAAEFRRSFETYPSLEALLAAARAYDQAGDTFAAIDAYEEYAQFEDENGERYDRAIERLRLLRAEVGELVLRIEDPSEILSVRVNGESVAFEDFPLRIMPGEVVVEIRSVDLDKPREITSRVRRGETTVLEISPRPAVVTPPPPKEPEPEPIVVEAPPNLRGLRVAFWGGVGLSAAAGIAVATLGGLTLRQRRIYYDALCEAEVCADGAVYPFAEEARFGELRRATNVVVGIGIGVAVVTLVVGGVLKRRTSAVRRTSAGIDLRGGRLTLRF